MLLYYALGGTVKEFDKKEREPHVEIANDTNNYVEITIDISGEVYVLTRYIGMNEIYVASEDQKIDVLPIYRSAQKKFIFSDWILGKLNIKTVDVFQGTIQHKINFMDLMRLIFLDQNPNPNEIYKAPDNGSTFVTDSLEIRKVIFQLLTGSIFSELYDAKGKYKLAIKERDTAKSLYDEYYSVARELTSGKDINIQTVQSLLDEKTDQLEKAYRKRELLKISRSHRNNEAEIHALKDKLIHNELLMRSLERENLSLLNELKSLSVLKSQVDADIDQLQKIIHSHKALNLFTPDTCPYCLNNVERPRDRCVCGAKIDEVAYEKFFYNEKEYYDILKSKHKVLNTIQDAVAEINENILENEKSLSENGSLTEKCRSRIDELLADVDISVDIGTLNDVDDLILKIKEDLQRLKQRYEIDIKLNSYREKFESNSDEVRKTKREVDRLEIDSQRDIESKIQLFNSVYNDLMVNTLPDCHSAKLDYDTYMPVINAGMYREASSGVPKRFNYYLTLFMLSLSDSKFPYPRFMMIDTPRTAGIDKDLLLGLLGKLGDLEAPGEGQVILTTGLGTYPPEFSSKVILKLDRTIGVYLLNKKDN